MQHVHIPTELLFCTPQLLVGLISPSILFFLFFLYKFVRAYPPSAPTPPATISTSSARTPALPSRPPPPPPRRPRRCTRGGSRGCPRRRTGSPGCRGPPPRSTARKGTGTGTGRSPRGRPRPCRTTTGVNFLFSSSHRTHRIAPSARVARLFAAIAAHCGILKKAGRKKKYQKWEILTFFFFNLCLIERPGFLKIVWLLLTWQLCTPKRVQIAIKKEKIKQSYLTQPRLPVFFSLLGMW